MEIIYNDNKLLQNHHRQLTDCTLPLAKFERAPYHQADSLGVLPSRYSTPFAQYIVSVESSSL